LRAAVTGSPNRLSSCCETFCIPLAAKVSFQRLWGDEDAHQAACSRRVSKTNWD
jgi:hypothetical protein